MRRESNRRERDWGLRGPSLILANPTVPITIANLPFTMTMSMSMSRQTSHSPCIFFSFWSSHIYIWALGVLQTYKNFFLYHTWNLMLCGTGRRKNVNGGFLERRIPFGDLSIMHAWTCCNQNVRKRRGRQSYNKVGIFFGWPNHNRNSNIPVIKLVIKKKKRIGAQIK